MSAFMCTDAHISALVNAAVEHRIDLPAQLDPSQTFYMLVAENALSITARYGKRDAPKKTTHRYTLGPTLPALHVIKLAQSYDYQSCEHEGWSTSEAKRWIDNLIAGLIFRLPGYDAAPWAI